MSRLARATGQWVRDRQAEGILRLLVRSPDRAASLRRFHDKVDDRVVSGLLVLSYLAKKGGDLVEMMVWADLAGQASLLGGTSSGRAEALAWQAKLFLEAADRDGTKAAALLDAADQAARTALGIYVEVGPPDEILTAHQLITWIHEARGDMLSALGSQLDSARVSADITDGERAAETVGRVAVLYWRLRGDDLPAGADMLLRDVRALLARMADRRVSADLLDALGDAHRQMNAEDAAFETWSAAAALYRDLGAHKDEFLVRGRMFDYAAELEQPERAREIGEACIAIAPADIPPIQLVYRHHLLAVTYTVLGQVDGALAAYRRAIELSKSTERGSGAATMLLLETALLENDVGRFDDARRDLEWVNTQPGTPYDWWLSHATLSDLHMLHTGDLGAAIAHADAALEISIDGLNNLTCRAHSLHRSGILYFTIGDVETAYNRFTQLMPILAARPEAILIQVSRLHDHPVLPPARAQCAWWAYRACEATGRQHEAAAHLSLHLDLICREPEFALPADVAEYADENLADGIRACMSGVFLMRTEPLEALTHLARAREELAEPELLARIDTISGFCLLRLNEHRAAAALFHRALDALHPGTETELEFGCRCGLAHVAAAAGRHVEAHEHLTRCVQLTEQSRSSISSVDGRISFLQGRLPVYEQLVEVCVRLSRAAEAFDAVQQVKSRSLVDLLAQPAHRPIDFTLDTQVAELKADREKWIAEYAGDTRRDDPVEDWIGSRDHQMLEASINHQGLVKAIAEERKTRGLFDKLERHEGPLDFASNKTLLRP